MKIAVVGATGLVGENLLKILQQKQVHADYRLFASNRSRGKKIDFLGKKHMVLSLDECCQHPVDYAFMMASAEVSKQYTPLFLSNGATVVDNSSQFRLDDDVPLVVPCVNGNAIGDKKLVANPNCTTIQVAIVLKALEKWGLKRVVVSTYQAVSGAGRDGLYDLDRRLSYSNLQCFDHPIFDNVIPSIGKICENGYTVEEMKMTYECKKILDSDVKVSCTAVRVPVSVGHGASVNIEFTHPFELQEIVCALQQFENVIVVDNHKLSRYPMPIIAKGTPFVYVGRLRRDFTNKNTLNCWIVADNLLRGASYNAYEIFCKVNNG